MVIIVYMVNYKCDKCWKEFDKKSTYDRHMMRKKVCTDKLKVNCVYCAEQFSSNSNRVRHEKGCKLKCVTEKNNVIKDVSINGSYNTLEQTNNSYNTTNNITIVISPFGFEEPLDWIPDDIFTKIICRGYTSINGLIDYVHFNKKHPENHNIMLSNLRSNLINIHDKDHWILCNKKEIINDLIDKKFEILDEMFDKLNSNPETMIPDNKSLGFRRFKKSIEDNDKSKLQYLKEQVELQLYNNRHIPKATHKKVMEQKKKKKNSTILE